MEVSLRAYARHRGVSLGAVQKAIRSARIQKTANGQIDAEAADVQWEHNTTPRPHAAGKGQQLTASPSPESSTRSNGQNHPKEAASAEGHADSGKNDLPVAGSLEYSRARAVRENYNARLAKMEFEVRTEKLISRDAVRIEAFNSYRTFRDGMLNIPNRLSAVVAAETDAGRVHELLSTEIRKALQEFADGEHG